MLYLKIRFPHHRDREISKIIVSAACDSYSLRILCFVVVIQNKRMKIGRKTHPMLQSNIGGILPQTIQDYIGFEGENQ